MADSPDTTALLREILTSVKSLKTEHLQLAQTVEAINGRVNILAAVKQSREGIAHDATVPSPNIQPMSASPRLPPASSPRVIPSGHHSRESVSSLNGISEESNGHALSTSPPPRRP
ncbi:hypothetical protein LTR53_015431, partial [Teratosphaeriaceae sp. CCFEE 6253]